MGISTEWGDDARIWLAISDVDEVPRAQAYAIVKQCEGYRVPVGLQLEGFFYYNLNWRKPKAWHLGPRLYPYSQRHRYTPQVCSVTACV